MKEHNPRRRPITAAAFDLDTFGLIRGALLMQQIRYLDKLIDELAKRKAMDKILRK